MSARFGHPSPVLQVEPLAGMTWQAVVVHLSVGRSIDLDLTLGAKLGFWGKKGKYKLALQFVKINCN